ncbi:hypothetical protein [Methanospirillum lacunae]|uniref:Lipocalin-like domain-containing protein n=1 Tax=Methanospirillum lacunae TaxID=668570 RepID=A0A2V2N3I0_9EURY|nr:hypothetical protein [Methanospirillum lacunae]PWR70031.1 hypothetical protein DK846_16530 [Methanospirillum lacunae]
MRTGFILACLLLCGCFGCSLVTAESPEYPNLVGTWTGVSSGYYEKMDRIFNETQGLPYTMTIPEQQGRIFKGSLNATGEKFTANYTFSGIIDHDMTTIYLAEKGTGMDIGHIVSPNEIEFIGLGLEDSSTAVINFVRKE